VAETEYHGLDETGISTVSFSHFGLDDQVFDEVNHL